MEDKASLSMNREALKSMRQNGWVVNEVGMILKMRFHSYHCIYQEAKTRGSTSQTISPTDLYLCR